MVVRPRLSRVERRPWELRTPGARVAGVRRMVVVRHDRLGDLVLSLPAIDALRRVYPGAHLALMVRQDLTAFARMIRGVDEVVGAGQRLAALERQFVEIGADLAVCISRGAMIARAAAAASVPHRVGTGLRPYSPLFDRRVVERRRLGGRHECEYALSFAHRVGAETERAAFPIAIPKRAERAASAWLAERAVTDSFVLLHPGSGGSCPAWPDGYFLELAGRLAAEGVATVFSIGPADRRFDGLLDAAPNEIRSLPRSTAGIEELSALLRRAAVVISNSTGPLHIAAALETPTLGFYPPWPSCSVSRWGPYASNGWGLVASSDDAQRWSRGRRRREGRRLMGQIPVAAAVTCALDLLRGRTPKP